MKPKKTLAILAIASVFAFSWDLFAQADAQNSAKDRNKILTAQNLKERGICYQNLRKIMDAIKNYEKKSREKMPILEFAPLVQGGFLKEVPTCPATAAVYEGVDLDKGERIRCSSHWRLNTEANDEEKECASNVRSIQEAVEKYNREVEEQMFFLTFKDLIDGGYLKEIPTCPAEAAVYQGVDLDVGGNVNCSVHGGLDTEADSEEKKCAENVRMLQGAVDKYNADHETLMGFLDLLELANGKYISEIPTCPATGAVYFGSNLNESGRITCSVHASSSATLDPSNPREIPEEAAIKCFANQKLIMGAVEMYNMDHQEMMDFLQFAPLVEKGYLKEIPVCPSRGGAYFGVRLTTDGEVKCSEHPGRK